MLLTRVISVFVQLRKKNVALRNREIFRSQALAGLWSGNYELIWPVCSVARISHLRVTFLPTPGNPNPAAARKSMSGFFIHEDFFSKNVKKVIFTCSGFSLRCSFSASKMRVFVRSILIMRSLSLVGGVNLKCPVKTKRWRGGKER